MPSEPLPTMAVGNSICYVLRAACLCENQGYTAKIGRGMFQSLEAHPVLSASLHRALLFPLQLSRCLLRGLSKLSEASGSVSSFC